MYEIRYKPSEESDFDIETLHYKYSGTNFQFTVGNVSRTIYLWHLAVDCRFGQSLYRMDIPGTLDIFTNLNVDVISVDDPHEVLSPQTRQRLLDFDSGWSTGYITDVIGYQALPVTMGTPAPEKDGKKAYVTMRVRDYPGENIPDLVFEIEAYYLFPNTYMLKPGESVHIPVRKTYRAWSQHPINSKLDENGSFGCEVIWQDEPGLITEIALTPSYSQKNIDSEIFVRTASTEGNAVVALTMNGKVVWSWLIWVSDYDPEATNPPFRYINTAGDTYTTFMSRNLGAFDDTNTSNDAKLWSQGLMYQWGRKDPFPAARDFNNSSRRPFAGNHILVEYPSGFKAFGTVPKPNWVNALEAYRHSVENPTTHIGSTAEPYHWAYEDTRLWYLNPGGVYYKTEFDPCPDGWRLPMASYPWGAGTPGSPNYFFDPVPITEDNNFGYTRVDGYYMPASGYIDEEGFYVKVGLFSGNWSPRRGMVTGESYDEGQTFYVDYDPGEAGVSNGYLPRPRAWAQNVRCSRED